MNQNVSRSGLVILLCLIGLLYLTGNGAFKTLNPSKTPITIGILIPMEHAALQEIVAGFKEKVKAQFPQTIFNVQSAQGDLKLQRSILELFVGQKMDMVVPVGTTATQMTISLVKKQPIVSLAAQFSEAERKKLQPRNMTGVLDEIGGKKKVDFIKAVIPEIKTITLITHSGNEKNYQEVAEIKTYGKSLGIHVQTLAIQNLPDLETAGRSIEESSGAILILKDHLLASGIRLLVPLAKAHGIPLIASDEGSVQDGANFALGVRERRIGEEGGELAVQVLQGQPIAEIPIQEMKNLAVFYNEAASNDTQVRLARHLDKYKVSKEQLQAFAKEHQYDFLDFKKN